MIKEFEKLAVKRKDYTLTKVEKNKHSPSVEVGDRIIGALYLLERGDTFSVKVEDGSSLVVTSPVKEIVDSSETSLTFKTMNSTYKLQWEEEDGYKGCPGCMGAPNDEL